MSAKPDMFNLMDVMLSIVRAHNEHITSEYRRCIGSSAGSNEPPPLEYFPRPTVPSSQTEPSTPPTGTSVSVLHTEDKWWTAQDQDPTWTNQWDVDDTYDNTDPKSWK